MCNILTACAQIIKYVRPLYVYIFVCLYVPVYVCMHTCVHESIHTHTHTHIHTYKHTYIQTYIHTYTHVHMHMGRKEGNVLFNDALNTFYLRLYGISFYGYMASAYAFMHAYTYMGIVSSHCLFQFSPLNSAFNFF